MRRYQILSNSMELPDFVWAEHDPGWMSDLWWEVVHEGNLVHLAISDILMWKLADPAP